MADVAAASAVNGPNGLAVPPLTQSDAIASLLSLSFAEGAASISGSSAVAGELEPASHQGAPGSVPSTTSVPPVTALSNGGKHHRRLSSTGKTRRRLSDAREAANRPSPSLLQQSSASGLSLAALSLSSSPLPAYPAQLSTSFGGASRRLAPAPPSASDIHHIISSGSLSGSNGNTCGNGGNGDDETNETGAIPIPSSNGRTGKKRGVDHKCESCDKIYRHPSCLIKHRWEHTPHWREASKMVQSKHQQVQLLEAAAILSHMSPAATGGTSLPEDRSLWPSFLSGGSLPPPDGATAKLSSSNGQTTNPISSSVPARAMSSGPRLHNYGVGSGVVTQVRPGLIGVTTSTGGVAVIGDRTGNRSHDSASSGSSPASQPVPVPGGAQTRRSTRSSFGAGSVDYSRQRSHGSHAGEESWGSQNAYGSYQGHTGYASHLGGISLPNSSVRSGSSPPRSLSRSRSGSVELGAGSGRRGHQQRLSDDSPQSDDEVFDDMDGVEEDRTGRGIRIVGDKYGSIGHGTSRSYEAFYGRYANGHTRTGSYPGRRLGKKDDEDDLDYHFAVREEDEDMDDMDGVGRLRKPLGHLRKVEQWDGMDMEMDMDMD